MGGDGFAHLRAGGVDGGHLPGDVDRLGLLFERQLDVERESCAGSEFHRRALGRLEAGLDALDVVAARGQGERVDAVGPGGGFKLGAGGHVAGMHLGSGDDGSGGIGDGSLEYACVLGCGKKERCAGEDEQGESDGSAKLRRTKWIHCGGLQCVTCKNMKVIFNSIIIQ